MIKLIATDLDNTALNRESHLSSGNRKAFEDAMNKGIEVVIATGRGLFGIPSEFFEIEGIRYAITSNGACIHNIKTGKVLLRYTLSESTAMKLLQIGKKYGAAYEIFVDGKAYVSKEYYADPEKYGMPAFLHDYIISTRHPVDDIDAFIEEHKSLIENFAYVTKNDTMHTGIADEVIATCKDTFVTSSDPQWVEVMSKESGKGKGLLHLCEYLNIDIKDTAAFGDADNDVEMLEYAGLSIAMENGSKACKEASDFVSDFNYNDGVAKGIYDHIL